MSEDEIARQRLTAGARKLADAALQNQLDDNHPYLGLNHWLLALIDRHTAMAEDLVSGFPAEIVKQKIQTSLEGGDPGLKMGEPQTIWHAFQRAQQRNRAQATERDLAMVILSAAGFAVHGSREGGTMRLAPDVESSGGRLEISTSIKVTPALDQFGRDLTATAREGKLSQVVGREEEIDLVVETLCRRTKRNPVLVGPAGVGKTAIVEGLAQRVIEGKVPDLIRGSRIISIQPSTLIAGAHISGELEKRMKAVLAEASQEGILLFFDEIHTIIGAGGAVGTTDVSSMLKPALARGEIACIAATTDDEYRRFIENDSALERRFQPIRIQELPPGQTLEVLRVLREELQRKDSIDVSDSVLRWLVDFGQQFMRNRHFPDKAVDLLEQCYAYAIAHSKKKIDLADAKQVAQRIVGMPVVTAERLQLLGHELQERRLLTDEEIQILINRLQVTLRGMDMHASRPNAILLLSGEAAENSESISETIAEGLFGASDRVISIDFSRFKQSEDVTLLVGSPPGYVGYNDRLPIHQLLQTPWCVLLLENVDECHPGIRQLLGQAITDGWIMDGRGKTIYLSDAIVVMTGDIPFQPHRGLGFQPEKETRTPDDLYRAIEDRIGETLAERIDLFSFGLAASEGVSQQWLKEHFLPDLCARYLQQDVRLSWSPEFLGWLDGQEQRQYTEEDWEMWADNVLSPAIIPFLGSSSDGNLVALVIQVDGDGIKVGAA